MPSSTNQNLILLEGAATYERILADVREVETDEGIRHIKDFIKIYPDYAPAHNDLAVMYYQTGDGLKALAHYEKAHKLDPKNINYRKNLADFYFVELEWTGDAINTYLDILKDNPFDIEALNALGSISLQIGRKELERIIIKLTKKYKNKIEWLRLKKNMGLAYALNEGLKYINYKWVVRADADDFNLHFRFAKLASMVLLDNELKLIGSSILEVDTKGHPIASRNVPESENQIRRVIKIRSPFNHMAVAYRLDAVVKCGGYPNVYLREDYALWCKMIAMNMHARNTRDVLVHATADLQMYKRRSGFKYAFAELHMQSILIECGLQNRFFAYTLGFLRMIVFLSPNWLRAFIYIRFLRDRKF